MKRSWKALYTYKAFTS